MRGLNSVTLGGNLARDAELRATQTSAVLAFTVCVNSSQKEGDGYVDVPNFVDCVVYGARGESLARYLTKGTYVALTGRIAQRKWETKDGQRRSKLEVIVSEIHFETRRGASDDARDDLYPDDCPF